MVELTESFWRTGVRYSISTRLLRQMLDIVFILGGTAFFVIAIGYALFCERL